MTPLPPLCPRPTRISGGREPQPLGQGREPRGSSPTRPPEQTPRNSSVRGTQGASGLQDTRRTDPRVRTPGPARQVTEWPAQGDRDESTPPAGAASSPLATRTVARQGERPRSPGPTLCYEREARTLNEFFCETPSFSMSVPFCKHSTTQSKPICGRHWAPGHQSATLMGRAGEQHKDAQVCGFLRSQGTPLPAVRLRSERRPIRMGAYPPSQAPPAGKTHSPGLEPSPMRSRLCPWPPP